MARSAARSIAIFALALAAAACGRASDPTPSDADDADRRQPPPPVAEARVIDADAPLDVRLLRVEPSLHVGNERVCDVLLAGQAQEVTPRTAGRYATPIASRRLVRCGAATGEGWVDLVFPVPSASFVSSVQDGTRLRVKVVAERGGFEDLPIVEFVAVLGNIRTTTARHEDFLTLPAGFDFGEVDTEDVGDERRCVVAYVGPPERLDEPTQARFPGRPTHRARVVCKHRHGDAWVELVFSVNQTPSVLALRRGSRATVRIVAARAGRAELPVVSLVEGNPNAS